MSSPEILPFDGFPDLPNVPSQSQAFLGEKAIQALKEAGVLQALSFALKNYPANIPDYHFMSLLNDLRHRFAQVGDERSSMVFADLCLAFSPDDSYTLNILSNWASEAQPEKAVLILLNNAVKFHDLPSLYSSCIKRASEICNQVGAADIAHQLLLRWQNLPAPVYDEIHLAYNGIESSKIRVPSPVENAVDGWRHGKWNPISPQQEEELRGLIQKYDLDMAAERIVSLSQNAIGIAHGYSDSSSVGASRLGGLPDVPLGWVWPENMEFLAQFNLEEIALFDINHALPSHGLLRIFAGDVWEGGSENCRVEWEEGNLERLQKAPHPTGYGIHRAEDKVYGQGLTVYSSVAAVPYSAVGLLSGMALFSRYAEVDGISEDSLVFEQLESLIDDVKHSHYPAHQLLGRYDDGQDWAGRAERVYDPLAPEEKLKANREMEDWTLLFRFVDDAVVGAVFGDSASVYIMIHNADLSRRDFSKVRICFTTH